MIEESVMEVEAADYEEERLFDEDSIDCIPEYSEVDVHYIPTEEEIVIIMQEAYSVDGGLFEDE